MNLTADERDMKDEMDYRDDVQRDMDDAADLRAASGMSPELMSLMDAGNEGQKAGFLTMSPSLNPYQSETPEHSEWERRRDAAVRAKLNGFRRAA